jgi:hypothetical protein
MLWFLKNHPQADSSHFDTVHLVCALIMGSHAVTIMFKTVSVQQLVNVSEISGQTLKFLLVLGRGLLQY